MRSCLRWLGLILISSLPLINLSLLLRIPEAKFNQQKLLRGYIIIINLLLLTLYII